MEDKIPTWTELGEQQKKIKAQTANVPSHPNLSASETRRKIDETHEAVASREKRRSSKKLPGEDAGPSRLRKRPGAAISARSGGDSR